MDRILMLWVESNPSTMEKNHLMLMGLMHHGVDVSAIGLCHSVKNREYFEAVFGESAKYSYDFGFNGVLFDGDNKISKLLNNLKIMLLFSAKLLRALIKQKHSAVIIPSQPLELTLPAIIIGRIFGVKVIPNIMEYYPSLPHFYNRKNIFQRWSWELVNRYSSAFIVISEYLVKRMESNGAKQIFKLPAILPDMRHLKVSEVLDVSNELSYLFNLNVPVFIYTSSQAYDDLLEFCIRSVATVKNHEFIITITGSYSDVAQSRWLMLAEELGIRGSILFTGFLTDLQLLDLQTRSRALLIPLLNDDRHRARFPQKILSYMQLGKPIITTMVGEFALIFNDEIDAVMDSSVTISGYGKKIEFALNNPDKLISIGEQGRDVVNDRFSYTYWGGELKYFLGQLMVSDG